MFGCHSYAFLQETYLQSPYFVASTYRSVILFYFLVFIKVKFWNLLKRFAHWFIALVHPYRYYLTSTSQICYPFKKEFNATLLIFFLNKNNETNISSVVLFIRITNGFLPENFYCLTNSFLFVIFLTFLL